MAQDHEVFMAQSQLDAIIKHATELKSKIGKDEKDIPVWIQDHVSKAENGFTYTEDYYVKPKFISI